MRVFRGFSAAALMAAMMLLGQGTIVWAQGNATPVGTGKVTPYFAPKSVVLVTATALPDKKGKGPSPDLANAADLELHSLLIGPSYRILPDSPALKATMPKPLPMLSAADIPGALHTIRLTMQADLAIYILVSAATSQQVTLQLWVDDPSKPGATVNGQQPRRNWTDYQKPDPNQALGSRETADIPNDTTKSISFGTPPLDTDKQAFLVRHMLEQWWTARTAPGK